MWIGMNPNIRWALRFWAICVASSIALIGVMWVVFGFGSLELTPNAMFALSLGTVFSVVIGAGLMALIFYSSRSGQDRAARGDDKR
jgi:hypothetical protein